MHLSQLRTQLRSQLTSFFAAPDNKTGCQNLTAPSAGSGASASHSRNEFAELPGAIIDGYRPDTTSGIDATSLPFGRFQGGYFLFDANGVTTFTKFNDFAVVLEFVITVPA